MWCESNVPQPLRTILLDSSYKRCRDKVDSVAMSVQGHLKRKTDKQVTLIQGVGRQDVGQSMGSVIHDNTHQCPCWLSDLRQLTSPCWTFVYLCDLRIITVQLCGSPGGSERVCQCVCGTEHVTAWHVVNGQWMVATLSSFFWPTQDFFLLLYIILDPRIYRETASSWASFPIWGQMDPAF